MHNDTLFSHDENRAMYESCFFYLGIVLTYEEDINTYYVA